MAPKRLAGRESAVPDLAPDRVHARPRENGQDLLRGKKVIVLPASKTVVFVFVLHVMHVVRICLCHENHEPKPCRLQRGVGDDCQSAALRASNDA